MKIENLTGAHLDYWTGRADGIPSSELSIVRHQRGDEMLCVRNGARYAPSTDWAQGGPIIVKQQIAIAPNGNEWDGYWNAGYFGPDGQIESNVSGGESNDCATALIAAMRAYVSAKFGGSVPDQAVA